MLTKILTHKDSIIAYSGQTKKWTFNFGIILLSGVLIFSGLTTIIFENQLNELSSGLIDAQIGLFLIGPGFLMCVYAFIRLSVSIRCPQCKLRWFWYGVARDFNRNINIGWMRNCQRCNYPN